MCSLEVLGHSAPLGNEVLFEVQRVYSLADVGTTTIESRRLPSAAAAPAVRPGLLLRDHTDSYAGSCSCSWSIFLIYWFSYMFPSGWRIWSFPAAKAKYVLKKWYRGQLGRFWQNKNMFMHSELCLCSFYKWIQKYVLICLVVLEGSHTKNQSFRTNNFGDVIPIKIW